MTDQVCGRSYRGECNELHATWKVLFLNNAGVFYGYYCTAHKKEIEAEGYSPDRMQCWSRIDNVDKIGKE